MEMGNALISFLGEKANKRITVLLMEVLDVLFTATHVFMWL